MSDVLNTDLISYDPLTEATRKERRALLGVSVLGIGFVKIPLVPTQLSAFGLEFAQLNQKAFVGLYATVVVYFLVAFAVYAFTDLVAWRRSEAIRYQEYLRQDAIARQSLDEELLKKLHQEFVRDEGCPYKGLASYRAGLLASRLRAFFEFVVPFGVSIYSVYGLLTYTPAP